MLTYVCLSVESQDFDCISFWFRTKRIRGCCGSVVHPNRVDIFSVWLVIIPLNGRWRFLSLYTVCSLCMSFWRGTVSSSLWGSCCLRGALPRGSRIVLFSSPLNAHLLFSHPRCNVCLHSNGHSVLCVCHSQISVWFGVMIHSYSSGVLR